MALLEQVDGTKKYFLNGKELTEIEYKKYLIEKEHKEFSDQIKSDILSKRKIKV